MTPATSADPFRYGWRTVTTTRPDGTLDCEDIPLTLEDVLHPQEGDVIPEAMYHESERRYLSDVFRTRPFGPRFTLVTSDLLVNWGIKRLRAVSPDVGVFAELNAEPDPSTGTLRLKTFGGRCLLVVEIVSPDKRENDVKHKLRYYHQVGVGLYVIVDQEREGGPRSLRAYQHTPKEYVPVPLDAEGRVALPPLGLLMGLRDERVVCYDAATGVVVGDYSELARTIERMDRRFEENERAMEETLDRAHAAEREVRKQKQARLAAAKARRAAERVAAEREQARLAAERVAAEREQARLAAERVAAEREQARLAAERVAAEKSAALQASQEEIRILKEMFRQLQAGQQP